MDKSTAIITVITGNWFNLNESTKGFDSYVVTTRKDKEFEIHAKEQGWGVILLDKPHTENLSDASIQSKDAKFLNFDKSILDKYDYILYHDHKYFFNKNQIKILKENIKDNYVAVGEDSFSIFIEYFRCMFYERYKVVEHKIRINIDWFIDTHGWHLLHTQKSANMSYLFWNMRKDGIEDVLKELQEEQSKFDHPECQILFNLWYYLNREKVELIKPHIIDGGLKRKLNEDYLMGKHY